MWDGAAAAFLALWAAYAKRERLKRVWEEERARTVCIVWDAADRQSGTLSSTPWREIWRKMVGKMIRPMTIQIRMRTLRPPPAAPKPRCWQAKLSTDPSKMLL